MKKKTLALAWLILACQCDCYGEIFGHKVRMPPWDLISDQSSGDQTLITLKSFSLVEAVNTLNLYISVMCIWDEIDIILAESMYLP